MTDLSVSESLSFAETAAQNTGIALCEAIDGLAAIEKPDVDLVIWRRALPLCLKAWLEQLEPSDLPDLRVLVQPANLRQALELQLDTLGMPSGDMRDMLVKDIDDLVTAFAGIAGTDLVDVRLERVNHDACWRFHRDFVEARLVTTYLGPATEWVQNVHAERALSEQKRFDGPLEHLQPHDVAFFKGSCGESGGGIVHRSPPIADTGQTRLLLCLNKRSTVSPEPWQDGSRDPAP